MKQDILSDIEVWHCVDPKTYQIRFTGNFNTLVKKKFCHLMSDKIYKQIVEERGITIPQTIDE
jgi:hypothetical protein